MPARGLALISDEVFADYAFARGRRAAFARWQDRTETLAFSMSGLSKIAGLPQMKLGWIVIAGPAPARAEAIEKLELIADTYLSVGTPVQHAAARLLELGQAIQQQIANSARQSGVSASGHRHRIRLPRAGCRGRLVRHAAGAAHPQRRGVGAGTAGDDNVLVQPGFFYDFESEAFLVFSLLTEPETFREGFHRLLGRVERR